MAERFVDGGGNIPMPVSEAEHSGISLRDWFAGHAMAAIIGLGANYRYKDSATLTPGEEIARDAYLMADALLQSREATHG